MGDALLIALKFIKAGLNDRGAKLIFFVSIPNGMDIIKGFLKRHINNYEVILNPNNEAILQQNKDITLHPVWSGWNIPDDKKHIFSPDEIEVPVNFDIKGDEIEILTKEYFVLQVDAGLLYHNPRKHWENIKTALSLAKVIAKKLSIDCYIVGNTNKNLTYPENFRDISFESFKIISYIKNAKFVIGLSSFVTFCSMMSNVPTILKFENKNVLDTYIHPKWFGNVLTPMDKMLLIDEIGPDIKKIKNFLNF